MKRHYRIHARERKSDLSIQPIAQNKVLKKKKEKKKKGKKKKKKKKKN